MRTNHYTVILVVLACIAWTQVRPEVHAGNRLPPDASTVTVFMENDVTDRTDWWYTSGLKISWISPELGRTDREGLLSRRIVSWMNHIPVIRDPGLDRTFSLSVGQSIYTPEETGTSLPDPDDRPYAGILYFSLGLHGRDANMMNTLELIIGMVGPHSYAEHSQRIFHEYIKNHQPQGWENQLKDEPVLNLNLDRKWRLIRRPNGSRGYEVIPYAGVLLGNAITAANAGAELRFGCLPDDFGTFMIGIGNNNSNAPLGRDDPRYSDHVVEFHFFTGFDALVIVRNIFLDGNTFRDSQSIEKEPVVANLFAGIGLTFHRTKITYVQVFRTKEFKGQDEGQFFGSITVSRSF